MKGVLWKPVCGFINGTMLRTWQYSFTYFSKPTSPTLRHTVTLTESQLFDLSLSSHPINRSITNLLPYTLFEYYKIQLYSQPTYPHLYFHTLACLHLQCTVVLGTQSVTSSLLLTCPPSHPRHGSYTDSKDGFKTAEYAHPYMLLQDRYSTVTSSGNPWKMWVRRNKVSPTGLFVEVFEYYRIHSPTRRGSDDQSIIHGDFGPDELSTTSRRAYRSSLWS